MAEYALPETFGVFNYCLLFVDILGQRDAFKGEGLLPPAAQTAEGKAAFFKEKLKPTLGRVMALQKRAHQMVSNIVDRRDDSEFRLRLNERERPVWDEMQKTRIITQY